MRNQPQSIDILLWDLVNKCLIKRAKPIQYISLNMFSKLKLKSKGNNLPISNAVDVDAAPNQRQIYQLRQNIGVNFGGCFVLEKWIFHLIFPDGSDCELAATSKLVETKGVDGAKSALEDHWKNYASDNDWDWLQQAGVNCVRVPLGYWEIPNNTENTNFRKFDQVYDSAWSIFKEYFIERAQKRNISILVDIHGLPGGANGADHSGEKGNGRAEFWGNSESQLQMIKLLGFVAEDLKKYENIAGIQVVNESEFADPPKAQLNYYKGALAEIRAADNQIPVIISDGWWTDQWVKIIRDLQNKAGGSLGLVIDHHCYRCFDNNDKNKPPLQIINDLNDDLLTNLEENGSGVDIMVGEYSVTLDSESWKKNDENNRRNDLTIEYGKCQEQLFNKRADFGRFFWTFKFESGNGGDWDFQEMVKSGAIGLDTNKNYKCSKNFDDLLNNLFNDHVNYWNDAAKGENMDHDRYRDGFTTAWRDAEAFASAGSKLGRIQAWKDSRKREHIQKKGQLKYLWIWEQGFDKALEEYYS